MGTWVCHGEGRAASGVTAGCEEGEQSRGNKRQAALCTLQTPGDQLYSANFVMVTWCAQCKSQMWREITGLEEMSHGRGKKRHPPTEGSTTAGQHDMEARVPSEPAQNPLQWANTSEACHTSALSVLPLPTVIPLLDDLGEAQAGQVHTWECNHCPSDHHQPLALQRCLALSKLSVFSFLFFFNVCEHIHVCDYGHLCLMMHMWRSKGNLRGWSLPSTLFETGMLLFDTMSAKLTHLRVSTGSSVSISPSHLTIDFWNYGYV